MTESEARAKTAAVPQIDLLFLCLARDCEATIPEFLAFLDRLEAHGFRCSAIVGENGSRDGTRKLIEAAAHRRVGLLDTAFMQKGARRLVRMAMGRQALLESAKERGLGEDYICVADLDNVMAVPPEPAAMRMAIERLRTDHSLFAVGATSRPVFYDLLALRAEGHDYSGLNAEIIAAQSNPLGYFQFHQRRIFKNQRLMTRAEPITCTSSFNGLCLYNAEDFYLGTYRSDAEAEICEHVSLNLSIARATGKRMLIAPELFIRAPADHTPVGFVRFWYDRIRKKIRSRM
jgi:hypothetical protein